MLIAKRLPEAMNRTRRVAVGSDIHCHSQVPVWEGGQFAMTATSLALRCERTVTR